MSSWIPRLQLFELEDQPWFPTSVRDYATDYLRFVQERFGLHRLFTRVLGPALERSGERRILDLCSGGGGPILAVRRGLAEEGRDVSVLLTDLFPNSGAGDEGSGLDAGVRAHPVPVDARAVPPELAGFRTLFNAFHHFEPEEARGILADAATARRPIGVFELPYRGLLPIAVGVVTPLVVAASTPFIRPFRWRRLLLTYLVPAVPFTCMWDGVVSMLRAYTPGELLSLARSVDVPGYRWEAGVTRMEDVPGHVTWLVGLPEGPRRPDDG